MTARLIDVRNPGAAIPDPARARRSKSRFPVASVLRETVRAYSR